jgi:hypothetical protein
MVVVVTAIAEEGLTVITNVEVLVFVGGVTAVTFRIISGFPAT